MELVERFSKDPARFLEDLVAGTIDVEPLLDAPNAHFRAFFVAASRWMNGREEMVSFLGRRLVRLAARHPKAVISRLDSALASAADDIEAEREAVQWIRYFRHVEERRPGAVALVCCRGFARAAAPETPGPQPLLRCLRTARVAKLSVEARGAQTMALLGERVECLFNRVLLPALALTEDVRRGGTISRTSTSGSLLKLVASSMEASAESGWPRLDTSLAHYRNAASHHQFEVEESGLVALRDRAWTVKESIEQLESKSDAVVQTAACAIAALLLVTLESALRTVKRPQVLTWLLDEASGSDAAGSRAAAKADLRRLFARTLEFFAVAS